MVLLLLSACDTSVKTEEAEVGAPVKPLALTTASEVFKIDTAKSKLTWIGAKITGRHNGVFRITSGEIVMAKGKPTGGNIHLDMLAVKSDDKTIDEASNKKLTAHLRSADFFDVERYPTATFIVTSITPYDSTQRKTTIHPAAPDKELRVKGATHLITGNLTIKDITKSVRFPARVTQQDSVLKAKANFNIDRTKWGLIYRADNSLGNQTIHPEVNIGIDIEAKRANL
ncbi:YceI family protein [Pontibacter fetidus]|uniref:YceI family protein n=1 Tax=Pontibacter fetidus TaxID=2700082 RepID=A0A6B2H451_9BACT|nr:YceI family protein [Pontibacter fetidus]NDK57153.1 YceI family protein [Pontibacter fetidus]